MSHPITYSPAFTLVPTYECFNRCTYCNFRTESGSPWLSLAAAQQQLTRLQGHGMIEILILSGEVHPQSARRAAWLERIFDLCQLALKLGFLPHTNVGPLSRAEMRQLRSVNVSMGLMLEQVAPALQQTVHRHAPSKDPAARLQQLEQAGVLRIPFTTGLLLGIGETEADWADTLAAIAHTHQRWGHIQEVILQPHQPGHRQAAAPCHGATLLRALRLARQILPPEITLQIPPNLIRRQTALIDCLTAGVRDLGGLVPLDEVNPDYEHPPLARLKQQLQRQGWTLQPRLPVYPAYDDWLEPPLRAAVRDWRDRLAALPTPGP
ncbi:7,8-didemethyl-8-hydroxy-5-deazariboflavin synthase subunit CofG [Romeria aff. gracilis LEGE 07310]|uniref:7,8-didemethyl-8-hydroxy-5-deazariboflavin synthase n=1 Tax=Vasconcelosia minhoensis LEGE 07310 TaxID=915328 RepID=A0A8J7B0M7_9CYAN|nr:7,8-didemethyl-8-hydroxy-5-deazariboflavin synthase subunit CofG [Romeria aff. gracilis LEGE 07310]